MNNTSGLQTQFIDVRSYEDGRYWGVNDTFHEEDAPYKVANFLRLVEQRGPMPESIIDIGCSSGAFLRRLAPTVDARLLGIDLAETAIERAIKRTDGDRPEFRRATIEEVAEHFELATLNDVFEHVEDYIGFLRSIKTVADTHYFHIPLDMTMDSVGTHRYMRLRHQVGHLHYFTEKSALATLEYCGYEVLGHQLNSTAVLNLKDRRSLRSSVLAAPRALAHRVNPSFAAHWLGGSTLSVLARPS